MSSSEIFEKFASHSRAVSVSSAGCGKTELIVRSVACCDSIQLILTHTHAGVDSIRLRLKKHGIKSKNYRVETIHSFALRYASAYPKLSSIKTSSPETPEDYINVIKSATRLFSTSLARDVLQNSYCGVYVDEYQDCTIDQHILIIKIANILPCRIVGDPLQAIFDFGGGDMVDWDRHIFPNFVRITNPQIPWRWKNQNPELGEWLTKKVRPQLKDKGFVFIDKELESIGCFWTKHTERNINKVLFSSNKLTGSNFAICCQWSFKNEPFSVVKSEPLSN